MCGVKGMKFINRKKRANRTPLEYFMEKIKVVETGCWEWQAAKNKFGYGCFGYKGKIHKAHRVSYQLFIGFLDKDLDVLHRCDNPSCVNAMHLFLGTHSDNMKDMHAKGRAANKFGENNGMSKLSNKQREHIILNKHISTKVMADAFNMHRCSILKIRNSVSAKTITLT